MKRVLITGASGLLGRPILNEFRNASWETLGCAFSRAKGGLRKVDIQDEGEVRKVLEEFKPSVVIHSAAERRPDVVEKQEEATKRLNVDSTAMIARLCVEYGAFMLYISTDYVFDGTSPPHKTDDQTNPLNKYGKSKLDGEKVTLENNPESAILRIPILYGEVEYLAESAVTVLFNPVQDTSKPAPMSDYEIRHPTHVRDIAVIIRKMAEKRLEPSVVIHSAAERRPDVVEKQEEATKRLNVDSTAMIARLCVEYGAFMLYISTDYVFDGTSPPHKTDDQTNPLNKYGKSKLDGEKVTLENNPESAILRIPILYGEVEYLAESAVTVLFNPVQDTSKPAPMSDYEIRHPTHVRDIAVIIRKMAEKRLEDSSVKGVFHWTSEEPMTKYTMAKTMSEVFGLPDDHIVGDKEPSKGAPRPYNAHLDRSRLEGMGITTDGIKFRDGIQECLRPFLRK